MYTIRKRFDFSASHQLFGLPEGHQCGRLHGHNYMVEVVLRSEALNDVGFVVDYGDLKPFREYLNASLDHRHLNDVLPFQTSAENIAKHLFYWCIERWAQTVSVSVSETPTTWAEYRL